MGRFKGFSMWRGRLPHWRAQGETYYVTFRHRRTLSDSEQHILFSRLMRTQRRRLDLLILCVLPEATEMVFRLQDHVEEANIDLSDVIEKEKRKASALICKATGEIRPVFYTESYDRIVRDDSELMETLQRIYVSPETTEICEVSEEHPYLHAPDLSLFLEEEAKPSRQSPTFEEAEPPSAE
jgi:hypothetical protein